MPVLPFPFLFIYLFLFVVNFVIHWNETAMGLHVFPIPIPPPTSLSHSHFKRSLWRLRVGHEDSLGSLLPEPHVLVQLQEVAGASGT